MHGGFALEGERLVLWLRLEQSFAEVVGHMIIEESFFHRRHIIVADITYRLISAADEVDRPLVNHHLSHHLQRTRDLQLRYAAQVWSGK